MRGNRIGGRGTSTIRSGECGGVGFRTAGGDEPPVRLCDIEIGVGVLPESPLVVVVDVVDVDAGDGVESATRCVDAVDSVGVGATIGAGVASSASVIGEAFSAAMRFVGVVGVVLADVDADVEPEAGVSGGVCVEWLMCERVNWAGVAAEALLWFECLGRRKLGI